MDQRRQRAGAMRRARARATIAQRAALAPPMLAAGGPVPWLVAALAVLGLAGLSLLLDPQTGRRRMARILDQGAHVGRVVPRAARAAGQDLANRIAGLWAIARQSNGPVDDEVLQQRVRSALGHVTGHAGALSVRAENGLVELTGPALAAEADAILAAARSVPGVLDVRDGMSRHEAPGDVPGLQGRPRPRERRAALLQRTWPPAARLLAVLSGVGAMVVGFARRGPIGMGAAIVGALAALRGVTNLDLGRIVGLGGRRGIDVQKSIDIGAPRAAVFELWDQFEHFPRFMSHVQSIKAQGPNRWRWTVTGPGRVPVSFDAVVTRREPGELLAWKSADGEPIRHAGVVRFEDRPGGRTRVTIRMTYNPPAGLFGHGVATLLGADPKRALDTDLLRLKSLLEHGRTTTDGQRTYLGDVLAAETLDAGPPVSPSTAPGPA